MATETQTHDPALLAEHATPDTVEQQVEAGMRDINEREASLAFADSIAADTLSKAGVTKEASRPHYTGSADGVVMTAADGVDSHSPYENGRRA